VSEAKSEAFQSLDTVCGEVRSTACWPGRQKDLVPVVWDWVGCRSPGIGPLRFQSLCRALHQKKQSIKCCQGRAKASCFHFALVRIAARGSNQTLLVASMQSCPWTVFPAAGYG